MYKFYCLFVFIFLFFFIKHEHANERGLCLYCIFTFPKQLLTVYLEMLKRSKAGRHNFKTVTTILNMSCFSLFLDQTLFWNLQPSSQTPLVQACVPFFPSYQATAKTRCDARTHSIELLSLDSVLNCSSVYCMTVNTMSQTSVLGLLNRYCEQQR